MVSIAGDVAHIFNGHDVSPANLARIGAYYGAEGFVCLRLLSGEECDEQVLEQWREVILRQHWTDDYKIVVRGVDGRVLDVNRHALIQAQHDEHILFSLLLLFAKFEHTPDRTGQFA